MVAVRTGFPSPMQPMGSFSPMALPAGQTPVPASVPPMPLAGFPPPPVKPPMAQQVSNAPRRRRFGDSLEGMLGRNMFAPQQQMVAPGMPMMRTPMPRPMAMGGAVQYFANGGNANAQAAASMMSAGIGNIGGKAITSGAQSVQDSFASSAKRRRKKRREKQRRLAAERAAAEQAIRDAEAAALAASQAAQQNNPNIAGPMESALQNFGGTAFQSAASSPVTPPPPPTDVTPEVFVPEVNPASGFASNLMNIERPDRILDRQAALFPDLRDDDPAFTQNIIPSEVVPENPFTYEGIGAIGLGDNREDRTASESVENAFLGMVNPDVDQSGVGLPSGLASPEMIRLNFGMDDEAEFPALPGNRGFEPEGTQIAPEAATIFGITPEEQGIVGGMSAVPGAGRKIIREKDDSFAESMFDAKPTIEEQTIIDGMSAVPGAGQKITPPKAGSSNRTGVDPQADQYRPSVNAAEAAYLQEALGNMDDPNFAEQVINKIIRNLTLGMFDPDDPQKREDAKAILDAYRDTGKFVYDSEGNAIDLSKPYDTPEGKAAFDKLLGLSKGAGIEPAVIGVRDDKGNIVGFDDGTGFRNTAEGTQNILTGSFDVFGGGDTATTITTGGGDDGGSDTGTDTGVDTGHTVDDDGNIVCNTEGYIYNPETKICEPAKEEEEVDGTPGSGIGTGTSGESFEDVLKRVVVAAPDVAPISANVRPMQEGGMAGLNRAADNFLQALAG